MEQKIPLKKICHTYGILIIAAGTCIGIYNIINSTLYYTMLAFAFCAFAFLPLLIHKIMGTDAAYIIDFILYLFSTLAYGIGIVLTGYHQLPYYDKFIHLLSGVVFTWLGSFVCCRLTPAQKAACFDEPLNRCFSFCFSLAVAGIWEILEYLTNLLFKNDPQNVLTTGINDTMQDMIMCLLGTVVTILLFQMLPSVRSSKECD